MARKPKVKKIDKEDEIVFFSEIDLKKDGSIGSEYPCWFFDTQIAEMEESIESTERQLKMGLIHPEMIQRVQTEVENKRERLNKIKESKPVFESGAKNLAYKEYKRLAEQLADSMPTRREDRRGFVSAHDEYKRLNTRHISLDPRIAKACGIEAKNWKVTGKEAARCYQIIGKALGENTNVERLRRDGGIESFKTMDGLTAKILERLAEGARRAQDQGK